MDAHQENGIRVTEAGELGSFGVLVEGSRFPEGQGRLADSSSLVATVISSSLH